MATDKPKKVTTSQPPQSQSQPKPQPQPQQATEQQRPAPAPAPARTPASDKPSQTDQPAPPSQKKPRVDRNASTQVGQIFQGWGSKLTERLPTTRPHPRKGKGKGESSTQAQIHTLVLALGSPEQPDHATAIDKLVDIGSPAVPALNEALNDAQHSWLTHYRAAEALGRIGDGRATGPLIQALQHPNSNVRWSAVRALALVGDLRALFELRRVAHEDHGRTSWGESVAGAAQSALDQIQGQSIWGQSMELIKTSFTSVLMILSLILAFSVVTTLRSEIQQVGYAMPGEVVANVRTPLPAGTPESDIPGIGGVGDTGDTGVGDDGDMGTAGGSDTTPQPAGEDADAPTRSPVPTPTREPDEITGKVVSGANVRPFPSVNNDPIGTVSQGDDIIFLGVSPSGMWYKIQLGESYADATSIDNPDGTESGWIHRELVSTPDGDVPVLDEEEGDDTDTGTDTPADDEEPADTTPTPEQ